MSSVSRRLIPTFSLLFMLGTASTLVAWQSPDDLPQASRLTDAPPAPKVIINNVEPASPGGESLAPTISPPRVPAPAIVPVEQIIAQPAKIEPIAPPIPTDDAPVGSGVKQAEQPDAAPTVEHETPNIKATIFKGIVPGETILTDLLNAWGKPSTQQSTADGKLLTFALAPFSRVETHLTDDIVQAIVIRLDTPGDVEEIREQLQLAGLRPAELRNDQGDALGWSFPERGVSLIFVPKSEPMKVARIQLQALSTDAFLLRVHRDGGFQWTQNLADLDAATAINPDDERIHWLKSEILTQQSEYRKAALAIERALSARPDSALYQLAAANLIGKSGKYDDAIAATSAVYTRESVPPLVKARAARQLGDLIAESPRHDFAQALQFHQQAIALALPLASSPQGDLRSAAKTILVEAHAAVAVDIAQGQWQKKAQAVPQWMDRGHALADEYVQTEGATPKVHFDILCQRLAAYAWLDGAADPADHVAQLEDLADKLASDASDPTFKRHVHWKLGKAMVDAVDVERARGNPGRAMAYGKVASELLTPLGEADWQVEQVQFQLSRMHFLLGAIQATQLEDHAAAVKWFEKVIDEVGRPEPEADLVRCAQRGEWLVSMGVSYWSVDRRDDALRLTQLGVKFIEAAQSAGVIADDSLVAPYNNLAVMHKELGNELDAQQYSEMAAKAQTTTQR